MQASAPSPIGSPKNDSDDNFVVRGAKNVWNRYAAFVKRNSMAVYFLEDSLKMVTTFLPGRYSDAQIQDEAGLIHLLSPCSSVWFAPLPVHRLILSLRPQHTLASTFSLTSTTPS